MLRQRSVAELGALPNHQIHLVALTHRLDQLDGGTGPLDLCDHTDLGQRDTFGQGAQDDLGALATTVEQPEHCPRFEPQDVS